MDFEKAKEIIENFNTQVNDFVAVNSLPPLKQFSDLQDKETIGSDYRDSQWYFENLSNFKAKYFSLRAYYIKKQSDTSDRVLTRKIADILAYIDEQIKMLDIGMNSARQRVKFYESVIYLVNNFNYGNY